MTSNLDVITGLAALSMADQMAGLEKGAGLPASKNGKAGFFTK